LGEKESEGGQEGQGDGGGEDARAGEGACERAKDSHHLIYSINEKR
jgi:hypothetical protein